MNYNGLLNINLLEDYLDGKLDDKAMHQVEKLSLEDAFVAEALAGLSEAALRSQSLSSLQKKLHDRVAQKPIQNKRWTITSQRLSIASAAAVLFIVVSVLFCMKENSRREIEANQAKSVKIEIAPVDKVLTESIPPTIVAVEIDKALAEAKTNTYAGVRKPKATTAPSPVFAPLVKASPVEETISSDVVSNIEMAKESRMSSATKNDIDLNNRALNEVVVTGVEARKISTPTFSGATISSGAEPIIGWSKFEEYLSQNNKLVKNNQPVGKSVQLSFTINDKNKPIAIKILNGLTREENKEAIRLLTDGPDWKYNPNYPKVATKITIKF